MKGRRKMTGIMTLVVASCLVLVSLAGARSSKMDSIWKKSIKGYPVWSIFKDGTAQSVQWKTHKPNPRFRIYDAGISTEQSDDLILDQETGLVWERSPSITKMDWYSAIDYAYGKCLGGRKGWRLPTMEELLSLVDPNENNPALPSDHPFINVQGTDSGDDYYSSTTYALDTSEVWYVYFGSGTEYSGLKSVTRYVWCVRGGQGHDGY